MQEQEFVHVLIGATGHSRMAALNALSARSKSG